MSLIPENDNSNDMFNVIRQETVQNLRKELAQNN